MTSSNEKIKIKVSEVARLLGWSYTTAKSIKDRKSPKDKYQTYLDCEKKLIEAKEQINIELSKH
ncbi:hypothetical protein EG349_10175 [Chryseobacterium shandongense]|jgi:hypothetical protein|uniref:Uncharacterized protein n=2 Tax=Chryseobacterium TaxID=59732 RepID=A0AAD1DMI3_9FLAO|nr:MULTISPECIES: hypothetical protein [Chryseobacterium]AZA87125.1 hypothetical protein EG349_10175 [Chryseobacterium shandongense]AZA95554.1 hypothetical protein EG353_08250 [Chryseobacterium shandongense]MEC3876166.1 hypothetical protein [Chryseobacterium sp. T9W2-O]